MSANSGSGGVRNLRAMFENKASDQSTSPPSRGRSPNPSELSNNSRPVSKVRASFVAVEKTGDNGGAPILGLRRINSAVSSQGELKESHTMGGGNEDHPLAKTQPPVKVQTASKPEHAHSTDNAMEGGLGTILKGSAFVDSTPPKDTSEARKFGEALSSGLLREKLSKSPSKPNDETKAAEIVQKMEAAKASLQGPPPTTTLQTTKSAQPVKAPPTRQAMTKPAPKSPVTSRPSPQSQTSPTAHLRGGPAKIRGVMESAKAAQRARDAAKQDASEGDRRQSSAQKLDTRSQPKPATESAKKERTPTSPKAARRQETVKPKSPTRPTKLPPVVIASTAASSAKLEALRSPTEPNSRKSVAKKPSSTSVRPPRASTSSTTSTLAKKTSHASLSNGHDRPKSRVSISKPDDGFLARMMRPTASSARKVHEKIQTNSPPRPKAAASHKPKDAAKHQTPPKMHLPPSKDHQDENKENDPGSDRGTLPDVAAASPPVKVKEDPTHADADKEGCSSQPTEPIEELNGEAAAV
ncbi:hypothetical protein A1O3_08493 [Capronia epimyces CBS 606.96]|uniref:Uncharacterized protein n=1 Tax=Capronia epimyces CBS 606.96 TaxID=1182542 RepID=W9XER0_9EURO|nr:uncharacterized protein A1O3_08493 [Capronia epimyces CBS 606.96]EXJ78992.1 hypothetical protein A1O3_08493 [Capronia epimyces CBS 606.96]